jgi:2-haloalkanoic acid dehalogenase type II
MSRFCALELQAEVSACAHGKFRNLRPGVTLLSMARPRALLLDFYGTLVHEDTAVIQAICREVSGNAPAASPGEVARTWSSAFAALTAASHGSGFRLQRELARMSLTDTVRYYHSAADPGSLLEAQFAYWQRPQIHPGARELLATTLPACAVSNIDRADLDAALAHHELAGYFTHLVTSQDARAYKPRPEMFTTALGLLGLGPHAVIHVGDSLTSDVAGAVRLGMPVAWVNRQRRPAPEAGPRPTYEVAGLGELLALLDG